MATYTEKYKFKKPASTDPVDIQDINNNMDKAEAALFKKADIGENGKVLESQLPPIPESDYMPFHGHTTKTADELTEPGYYINEKPLKSNGYPLTANPPCIVEVFNDGMLGWQKVFYPNFERSFIRSFNEGKYSSGYKEFVMKDCTGD